MTSAIDPNVIVDNEPVDKDDLRNQFQIAAEEITALQKATGTARLEAFSSAPDINGLLAAISSITVTVNAANRRTSYAYDLAFNIGDSV